MRRGAVLAALLLAAGPGAARACAPDLPAAVPQGGLVVGRVAPGCTVEVGGRALRLAADGGFVFGVGRDAPSPLTLTLRDAGGRVRTHALAVTPRQWRIERVDGVPQSTVTPAPAIAARIAREQARVAQARERDDAREDYRFGFAWPARGRISGVYGSQRVLNGEPKNPHMGLDIAAPTGTQIAAPLPGVVTLVHPDMLLTGKTVVIDHGHGVSSVYIHMSRIDVSEGQRLAHPSSAANYASH